MIDTILQDQEAHQHDISELAGHIAFLNTVVFNKVVKGCASALAANAARNLTPSDAEWLTFQFALPVSANHAAIHGRFMGAEGRRVGDTDGCSPLLRLC
eukprot:678315-Amphidinium_carterae.1